VAGASPQIELEIEHVARASALVIDDVLCRPFGVRAAPPQQQRAEGDRYHAEDDETEEQCADTLPTTAAREHANAHENPEADGYVAARPAHEVGVARVLDAALRVRKGRGPDLPP
jgi:hypothetical protein